MALNASQLRIFYDRYALKDSDGNPIEADITEMWSRVASAIATVEKTPENVALWTDKFRSLLEDFKFVPAGRILSAAGSDTEATMMNCYVLPSPEDSCSGIMERLSQWVEIQRRGGGVGINMSSLRPNGARVKSVNGTSSGPIAWMELFSTATEKVIQQGGTRRGAAMLMLNDDHPDVIDFINVKKTPGVITGANLSVCISNAFMEAVQRDEDWNLVWEGEIYHTIRARDMWDMVCEAAHASAEPGIYFMERANQEANSYYFEKLVSTNPCWAGNTLVATIDGPKEIQSLVGTTPYVYSWDPETKNVCVKRASKVWLSRKNTETITITLDSGTVLRLTPDHNLFVFKGKLGIVKMKASEIKPGMSLKAYGISPDPRNGRLRIHSYPAPNAWVSREIYRGVIGEIPEGYVVHHKDHDFSNNDPSNLVLKTEYDHQSGHYPEREKKGFGRHGWTTPEIEVHAKIKETLLMRNHKVVSVDAAPSCDVYNMTVEDTHTYVVVDPVSVGKMTLSGIVSANCAEQPLGPYGTCLLGAFNLDAYVKDGVFQVNNFKKDIYIAVRFMDNVIDVTAYPLRETEDSEKSIRRMGIGIMGLADAFIHLDIVYGSAKSEQFVENVFSVLRDTAYLASSDLAVERGSFSKFNASKFLKSGYAKRLPTNVRSKIKNQGIRNCYLLTNAPTGTTSILAGVFGGIEPFFDFYIKREDRTGTHYITTKPAEEWMKENNITDVQVAMKSKPATFVTANDLTPEEHVKIQAIAQKYIDSSISKTVNAPNSHSIEDVKKLYMLAYVEGLKSISYYRDGSRDVQVLHHVESEVIEKPSRRRLPALRKSITHKFSVGGQDGYLTVGLFDDGTPGELFLNINKEGSSISGWADSVGVLTSLALQSGMDLELLADKMIYRKFEPSGFTENPEIPNAHSIVDYVFRFLVKQFSKVPPISTNGNGNHSTSKTDLPRILVTAGKSGDTCSVCGEVLYHSEGCSKCAVCDWTKC